jgi:cytochrome P450
MAGVSTVSPTGPQSAEERFPLGAAVRLADLDVDPYPTLAVLRRDEPVSWVPETGMWFVTRRREMVSILRDATRFTTDAERSTIRDIFGAHMMTTDGEVALRYKRSCLHAFRADALESDMGPWVRAEAERLVAVSFTRPEPELMADVATPLAVRSALRVLGLPLELADQIARWFEDFAHALANFSGDAGVRARGKASAAAFADAVRPRLRSASPSDRGLLTQLATRREDSLSQDEIIANALIILFGGIETTASMIGNTIWSLVETGWWPRLVQEPARAPDLIEESLRWQPAVQSITRHSTEEVEILGVSIPRGSVVQSMIGAANRDPDHFVEPDTFDPGRANASDHLSFGTGRHLCLGAHLARMEITAVLDALRGRAPELGFAGETPVLRGYEFRRPGSLTVQPLRGP